MGNGFSTQDVPSQAGKVAVITGANTGVGYRTALHLLRQDARVIMACRSKERAEAAIESLRKELVQLGKPQAEVDKLSIEFLPLDLMSMKQVQEAADSLVQGTSATVGRVERIDMLINNAGIMTCPFALSKDNLESQFGTNHMSRAIQGHFVFTMLLLPLMTPQTGRIVNLSSEAHRMAPAVGILPLEQLSFAEGDTAAIEKAKSEYKSAYAYASSKLANVLFTNYLAARLPKLMINSVHPGFVDTELQRSMGDTYGGFIATAVAASTSLFAISPENGARASLCVATSPEIEEKRVTGQYFVPYGKLSKATKLGTDTKLQERLWDMSIATVRAKLGDATAERILKNVQASA
ncbi:hypothetical protein RI367_007430 [Sorochytrium milnesiophthora]